MAAVSFPILRLPNSALRKALKEMRLVDQMYLSLLSENTMQLVRKLNRGPCHASITAMESTICVQLWTRCAQLFFEFKPDQSIRAVNVCNRDFGDFRVTEFAMPKIPEFTVKKWIEHISHVFFSDKGATLKFMSSVRNIEETCEILKEVKILKLRITQSTVQDCQMLRLFPSIIELNVSGAPVHRSMVNWNLEKLNLFSTEVALDDLLLSNWSNIS